MEESGVKRRGRPVLAVAILLAAAGIGAGILRLALGAGANPVEGNEHEALRVLDSVARLEELWRDGDADGNGAKDFWTADWSGFYRAYAKNGKPAAMTSEAVAAADAAPLPEDARIAPSLPSSPHAGYWFKAVRVEAGWAFAGFPAEPGKSGRRVFLVREDGRLWAKEGSGAPAAWPAAGDEGMRAAGWTLTRP